MKTAAAENANKSTAETLRAAWLAAEDASEDAAWAYADSCRANYPTIPEKLAAKRLAKGRAARAEAARKKAWAAYQAAIAAPNQA